MDKSLTFYGVCDDCKQAGEPTCFPPDDLRVHEGRLLCNTCFDEGNYAKYDEAKDDYLPRWRDLELVNPEGQRLTVNGQEYEIKRV